MGRSSQGGRDSRLGTQRSLKSNTEQDGDLSIKEEQEEDGRGKKTARPVTTVSSFCYIFNFSKQKLLKIS